MRYVFDHVHVLCSDLEPVIVFLTEAFGAKLLRRRMIGAVPMPGADIQIGDTMLYIKQMGPEWKAAEPTGSVCGYNHIGFLVDDMDAALKELTARPDTRLVLEPYVAGKRLCAFLTGPDNLYVEIMKNIE